MKKFIVAVFALIAFSSAFSQIKKDSSHSEKHQVGVSKCCEVESKKEEKAKDSVVLVPMKPAEYLAYRKFFADKAEKYTKLFSVLDDISHDAKKDAADMQALVEFLDKTAVLKTE